MKAAGRPQIGRQVISHWNPNNWPLERQGKSQSKWLEDILGRSLAFQNIFRGILNTLINQRRRAQNWGTRQYCSPCPRSAGARLASFIPITQGLLPLCTEVGGLCNTLNPAGMARNQELALITLLFYIKPGITWACEGSSGIVWKCIPDIFISIAESTERVIANSNQVWRGLGL